MKKSKKINYVKPNMGALPPKVGRKVLDIMAKTPKSDQTKIDCRVKEVQAYFEARQSQE